MQMIVYQIHCFHTIKCVNKISKNQFLIKRNLTPYLSNSGTILFLRSFEIKQHLKCRMTFCNIAGEIDGDNKCRCSVLLRAQNLQSKYYLVNNLISLILYY